MREMAESDVIAERDRLVTEPSLLADLRASRVRAEMTLLVHSSLSSLGWVCGEWVPFSETDLDEVDFAEVGSAFERTDTTTRKGRVGTALATLLPAQPLVDFAGRWFRQHRRDE